MSLIIKNRTLFKQIINIIDRNKCYLHQLNRINQTVNINYSSNKQELFSTNHVINKLNLNNQPIRLFTSNNSKNTFEYIVNETLESLTERFDQLSDEYSDLVTDEYDVSYSNGVLTVKFDFGTYVLNKQTPNSQIWLSSPISGPKRYDLIDNKWIYKHDGETLHSLLNREISKSLKKDIDFKKCLFAG